MIISNSSVSMSSKRSYTASKSSYSNLMTWGKNGYSTISASSNRVYSEQESSDGKNKKLSDAEGQSFSGSMDDIIKSMKESTAVAEKALSDRVDNTRIQFETLSYLWRLLFGKGEDNFISRMEDMLNDYESGGEYQAWENYSESETTTYSSKGTVVTADGREISFNVKLSMTRAFEEEYSTQASWGAAMPTELTDPLVINLDDNPVSVSDQSFLFDIDADGTADKIKMPTGGSGFLAIDLNGDKKINDGSELFGTSSGDGFADLAAYDEDGNGWIDEADSVFKKLLVYSKDSSGNDKLVSIGQAGVGAIYLGSADTQFSLNDKSNNTNAVVRKSGIFLYENGNAGTIAHVDFAAKA